MILKTKQLIKNIFKKNMKLLFKVLIILSFWFVSFSQQSFLFDNIALAQETSNATAWKSDAEARRESIISTSNILETVSKLGYLLLWPLVALAWLAMDNSLVYGSFIWLDVPLWKIWQIVRNFANYTLWFLFLVGILIFNFTPSRKVFWNAVKTPWELIKKTLIASVLIQASRFLMMALVDISTILTYSIWWLPSTVLTEVNSWSDTKVLQESISLNLTESNVETLSDAKNLIINYWTITWQRAISPCEVVSLQQWTTTQSFVIWRKYSSLTGTDGKTTMIMEKGYCIYLWSLISFNDAIVDIPSGSTYSNELTKFSSNIKQASEGNINDLIKNWIIFPVSDGIYKRRDPVFDWGSSVTLTAGKTEVTYEWKGIWCNNDNLIWEISSSKTWEETKNFLCLYKQESDIPTLNTLIKKAWSMTGPFAALYANMALFSSFSSLDPWIWIRQKFVVMFINSGFAILLILPLVALVVVLFARIWILRMLIALSPFIILIKVFSWLFDIKLPISLKTEDLVKLLLAPVLISFAVSLSLVFMATLKNSVWNWLSDDEAMKQNLSTITWIEEVEGGYNILWFIKLKMDTALHNLSWILTMLFGLWVTWFLLFRAIKSTWQVWEKIWWKLQKLWETTLWSMPLVPFKWWALTFNSLTQLPTNISNEISNKMRTKNQDVVDDLLGVWSPSIERFYRRNSGTSFISYFKLKDDASIVRKYNELSAHEQFNTGGWSNSIKKELDTHFGGKDTKIKVDNNEYQWKHDTMELERVTATQSQDQSENWDQGDDQ